MSSLPHLTDLHPVEKVFFVKIRQCRTLHGSSGTKHSESNKKISDGLGAIHAVACVGSIF